MDHGVLMLSQLRVVAGIVGRARGRGRPGKGAAEETLISQQNGLWFAPGTVLHHSGGDGGGGAHVIVAPSAAKRSRGGARARN